jgi:hypothetical protein
MPILPAGRVGSAVRRMASKPLVLTRRPRNLSPRPVPSSRAAAVGNVETFAARTF